MKKKIFIFIFNLILFLIGYGVSNFYVQNNPYQYQKIGESKFYGITTDVYEEKPINEFSSRKTPLLKRLIYDITIIISASFVFISLFSFPLLEHYTDMSQKNCTLLSVATGALFSILYYLLLILIFHEGFEIFILITLLPALAVGIMIIFWNEFKNFDF